MSLLWGQFYEGESVEQVLFLKTVEHVCLNHDRVAQLRRQLGESATRDVVGRAMEELALRLEHIHELYIADNLDELRKSTRSLLAIADQIGLDTLTMVAEDVIDCIDFGDSVALAATQSRLLRIGKCSLNEIWDKQGLGG